MRSLSPSRRTGWSKYTSYPTVNSDRKQPGEVSMGTKVNKNNAEKELDNRKQIINNMKRKSMSEIDNQKRQLEKSMMAYTEKMKQISNSRTNELFREIHTRNAMRSDDDAQTTVSSNSKDSATGSSVSESQYSIASRRSLPVRLGHAAQVRRHNELRSLKGFSQVDIRSPILEKRENTTPELARSARMMGLVLTPIERNSSGVPSAKSSIRTPNPRHMCETHNSPNNENRTVHRSAPGSAGASYRKPLTPGKTLAHIRCVGNESKIVPRVAKTVLPWMARDKAHNEHQSDSAYSSGSDDVMSHHDNDVSVARMLSGGKTRPLTAEERMLITVPKIHVRRQKIFKRRKLMMKANSQKDNFFRRSLIKRADAFTPDHVPLECSTR